MSTKMVFSIYLDVEKDSEEVSALFSNLIGNLTGNHAVTFVTFTEAVEAETKKRKTRKPRRPMTDEEKAVFRARMIAGREAKANEKEDANIDAKADVDLEKKTAMIGAKPLESKKANAKTDHKGEGKTSSK